MAEKKEVITLLNRSKRHYDTVGADEKAHRHAPGTTHEYTPEQAAQFDPKEMIDLSKVPGSVDKEALRKENAALKAESEALKRQLAVLTPKPEVEAEAAAGAEGGEGADAGSGADGGRRNKKK